MTDRVTVAVVAYNDAQSLERCVRSLRDAVDAPIVVVDNHSEDDTWNVASNIAAELPGITPVLAERNGGYAAGGNIARRHTETEYLAIMNADCETQGDWVAPIIKYLDAHPNTCAASPTVVLAGGDVLNAEGLDIHKAGFGFNRHLGSQLGVAGTEPTSVPGVQGTAFVMRVEALDDIGGWYEGGFLYHEDVELSWALRLAGYDIAYVPTPPVVHDYELTMSPEKFFLLERNRLDMVGTDLSLATTLLLAPVLVATEVAVWAYALRKGSAMARAKLRSYRSFAERGPVRSERRKRVRAFQRISDRDMLAAMQWHYPRSQTNTLNRSSATSGRRGNRDMPTSRG
jgi:GT2 family glycosyltransferase